MTSTLSQPAARPAGTTTDATEDSAAGPTTETEALAHREGETGTIEDTITKADDLFPAEAGDIFPAEADGGSTAVGRNVPGRTRDTRSARA